MCRCFHQKFWGLDKDTHQITKPCKHHPLKTWITLGKFLPSQASAMLGCPKLEFRAPVGALWQCRFGILSHLTGHYPTRDGSATQSTWCYVRKYVPVNFLRISNENVKFKYKIAVFVKRVMDCCRNVYLKWRSIGAVALPLEVNRSREQRFLASTCGIWEPGLM